MVRKLTNFDDQIHPEFKQKYLEVKKAALALDIAELELQAVCVHNFHHDISYSQCTVCGIFDRDPSPREDLKALAVEQRKILEAMK